MINLELNETEREGIEFWSEGEMTNFRVFWVLWFMGVVSFTNGDDHGSDLMVPLTLIQSAAAKGAYCMDGSAPAYHFSPGFGPGENSWIIDLEGGGWCNNKNSCVLKRTDSHGHGSSNYMEKETPFTGILSNKPDENPDFYNWNRARIRYCDGGSFASEGYDQESNLYFRGQRIWSVAMEEMMSKGMRNANQVLLSGCSAGGLATILHCDQFRAQFPSNTTVKCFADAGMFLDAIDVSGGRYLRNFFQGVVDWLGVSKNLPSSCTSRMDTTSCIFPENLISNIQTPIFILNSAYDVWQIQQSLAIESVDPMGAWETCKSNYTTCTSSQIQFLQGFRDKMASVLQSFSDYPKNGVFLNSCFAHCQSGDQETWYANNAPELQNKGIAKSVADWYFDRAEVKAVDCPYPCDSTCHNVIHKTGTTKGNPPPQFTPIVKQSALSLGASAPISPIIQQESKSPTTTQQGEIPTMAQDESNSRTGQNHTVSSWSSALKLDYVPALSYLVYIMVDNIVV